MSEQNSEVIARIHSRCMGMYSTQEARDLANTIINEIEKSKKEFVLYVQVERGLVSAIYGDRLKTDLPIRFVVRDMDNINAGDHDPLPFEYDPDVIYW